MDGFEADCSNQIVDGVGERFRSRERVAVCCLREGQQQAGGQRGIDSFEQFHKQRADAIAIGEEAITAGVREFFR